MKNLLYLISVFSLLIFSCEKDSPKPEPIPPEPKPEPKVIDYQMPPISLNRLELVDSLNNIDADIEIKEEQINFDYMITCNLKSSLKNMFKTLQYTYKMDVNGFKQLTFRYEFADDIKIPEEDKEKLKIYLNNLCISE